MNMPAERNIVEEYRLKIKNKLNAQSAAVTQHYKDLMAKVKED